MVAEASASSACSTCCRRSAPTSSSSSGAPASRSSTRSGFPEDGRRRPRRGRHGPRLRHVRGRCARRYARLARTSRSRAIAMRLLTPFPRAALRDRLAGAQGRAGREPGAPLAAAATSRSTSPTRSSDLEQPPVVVSAFAGLGGADVSEATWEAMLDHARLALDGTPPAAVRAVPRGGARYERLQGDRARARAASGRARRSARAAWRRPRSRTSAASPTTARRPIVHHRHVVRRGVDASRSRTWSRGAAARRRRTTSRKIVRDHPQRVRVGADAGRGGRATWPTSLADVRRARRTRCR